VPPWALVLAFCASVFWENVYKLLAKDLAKTSLFQIFFDLKKYFYLRDII